MNVLRSAYDPASSKTPHGRIEALARHTHEGLRRVLAKAPWVIAVVRAVFYPFALALLGYIAYRAAMETDWSSVSYAHLVAAFVAAVVWWVSLAVAWASLIGDRAGVVSWCRTQVARYVPGAIWVVIARATSVKGRLPDKLTAVTAEYVIVLLIALAAGGVLAGVEDWRWFALVPLAAAPLVASGWLERRTKLTRGGIHRTTVAYSVGYLAYGVSAVLVQVAISGDGDLTDMLYVAGAACVAWAVGLLAVFAPGGVGVREIAYVWMLSGLYPTVELQAAAVATRLITVLAELAVLAVVSRPRPHRLDAVPRSAGSEDARWQPTAKG